MFQICTWIRYVVGFFTSLCCVYVLCVLCISVMCGRRLLESERRTTELMELLAKKEEALQKGQVS